MNLVLVGVAFQGLGNLVGEGEIPFHPSPVPFLESLGIEGRDRGVPYVFQLLKSLLGSLPPILEGIGLLCEGVPHHFRPQKAEGRLERRDPGADLLKVLLKGGEEELAPGQQKVGGLFLQGSAAGRPKLPPGGEKAPVLHIQDDFVGPVFHLLGQRDLPDHLPHGAVGTVHGYGFHGTAVHCDPHLRDSPGGKGQQEPHRGRGSPFPEEVSRGKKRLAQAALGKRKGTAQAKGSPNLASPLNHPLRDTTADELFDPLKTFLGAGRGLADERGEGEENSKGEDYASSDHGTPPPSGFHLKD